MRVEEKQYEKETISVIVPIYNTEPYLNRCIDSIIAQTYRNLDIILVDDGSVDRSGEICEAYEKKDKRVRVIHQQNGGAASARNSGLEIAKGKYIGFVDSDDFITADMYESLIRCLDDDVDIVTCGKFLVYPSKNWKIKAKKYCAHKINKYGTEQAIEELLKGQLFSNSVYEKLYRKELFDGLRFPQGRISEDHPVTYTLFKRCRNVVNIGEAKYYQYRREDSISRKEFFFRRIDIVLFHRDVLKDIQKEYPQFNDIAEANYINSVVRQIGEIRKSKDRALYRELDERLIKVLKRMQVRIVFNSYLDRQQKEIIFKKAREKNR